MRRKDHSQAQPQLPTLDVFPGDTPVPDPWSIDLPTDYLAPAQLAPEAPSRQRRVSRKLIAGTLAVGALLGGGVAGVAGATGGHHDGRTPVATSHPNIGTDAESNSESLTLDLPQVESDFTAALAQDDCAVKVTPTEATATYQQIFGGSDLSRLNESQLASASQSAIASVNEARQEAGVVSLPEEFTALKSPSTNIPIAQYETALQGYLSNFGIKPFFTWREPEQKPGHFSEKVAEQQLKLPNEYEVKPVSQAFLEGSKGVRRVLYEIGQDLSMLSPQIIHDAGIKNIIFGQFPSSAMNDKFTELGKVQPGGDAIYINIDPKVVGDDFPETASHEVTHLYAEDGLCQTLMHNLHDTAYTALNGGFKYSQAAENQLSKGKTVEGGYADLEDAISEGYGHINEPPITPTNTKIVVATGYGATAELEDRATLLGQEVFYAPNTPDIFDESATPTPLKEKVALEVARVTAKDPASGRLLLADLQLGRIGHEIQDRTDQLRFQQLTVMGSSPTSYEQTPPAYQALQTQIDQYADLESQLMQMLFNRTE